VGLKVIVTFDNLQEPIMVVIRRIVGSALASAALAAAVGVLAEPTAAALPRQCNSLIIVVQSWHDQWEWDVANYGESDARTQYADQQATKAFARQINAGC
jgi:hypothetical protein